MSTDDLRPLAEADLDTFQTKTDTFTNKVTGQAMATPAEN
jgi:hypothetical protein